jgi:hypothetical protein
MGRAYTGGAGGASGGRGRCPDYSEIMRATLTALMASCFCAAAAWADSGAAVLEVFVEDAAMLDVIVLRNVEACGPISGLFRVDFGPSEGQVVIDTEYGGAGTQDPWTPVIRSGPARLMPVEDGARVLDLMVAGLAPGEQVVVTLDIDNERGLSRAERIVATGADIAGGLSVFMPDGPGAEAVTGELDATGRAVLAGPVPCRPAEVS